jgi:hypothetical protein
MGMGSSIQKKAASMKMPSVRCPANESPGREMKRGRMKPAIPSRSPAIFTGLTVAAEVFIIFENLVRVIRPVIQ